MKGEKGDVFIGGKQIEEVESWEIVSYPEKIELCFTMHAANSKESALICSLLNRDKPQAFRILMTEDGALTIDQMTAGA